MSNGKTTRRFRSLIEKRRGLQLGGDSSHVGPLISDATPIRGDESFSGGRPKRRPIPDELMSGPESKRGKEYQAIVDGVLEDSLADLFHDGSVGSKASGRQRRSKKGSRLGQKVVVTRKVVDSAVVLSSSKTEEADQSMPSRFHEAHIMELSGVGTFGS